jgi:hypothetical protein
VDGDALLQLHCQHSLYHAIHKFTLSHVTTRPKPVTPPTAAAAAVGRDRTAVIAEASLEVDVVMAKLSGLVAHLQWVNDPTRPLPPPVKKGVPPPPTPPLPPEAHILATTRVMKAASEVDYKKYNWAPHPDPSPPMSHHTAIDAQRAHAATIMMHYHTLSYNGETKAGRAVPR